MGENADPALQVIVLVGRDRFRCVVEDPAWHLDHC